MFRVFKMMTLFALMTGLAEPSSIAAGRDAPAATAQPHLALAFIVNKSNPVDNLSHQDLRRIFLGERSHWPNGRKISLVMQEQGREEREVALRLVYHMSESDYDRYILQAAFTGSVQSGPRLLSSASGVRKFVSFVPGAIGYVYADETDDSVKVIKIDGLAPDQAGYKFTLKEP